jgi:hypothetical protein
MASKPKPAYRRHGDLPAYFQFRDGRPAWIPSQGLRDAGWRRCDLKDVDGRYLSQGAAIDRAALINDAVARWREGYAVSTDHAAYAPAGACDQAPVIRRVEDRLSIGTLIDAWCGVAAPFKGGQATTLITPACDEFAQLAASTQTNYRQKIKRLVDVLAGWPAPPPKGDPKHPAYLQAVADVRAESIFTLQADEDANGVNDPLREVYWILRREAGPHQANSVLTITSAWLSWCRLRRTRRIHNWAAEVDRLTAPGRIRVFTWPELQALVRAAEDMGWHSIADSIVLGVDLSWSQADRLALTWNRVITDINGRQRALTRSQLTEGPKGQKLGRAKTGRIGGTPFLDMGRQRIEQIRARQAHRNDMRNDPPTHVLICDTTGEPWKADYYKHKFADVRARAALACPSVADGRDQDLRDTAVTFCRRAGLTIEETCSRTLQSRRRVLDLWDQAYGEIGEEIADSGADRMDAWMKTQKVAL